ncbi:Hypothetical predicted protein [Paramuricea clavata]|uniref:Uncharacterized protein n=1 Tax=Paramuricea clavata TaxID=317549 RepID=A0A7D9EAC0_PARCT|nr:Hypothetical predicted protein [Paramuricea clavata]
MLDFVKEMHQCVEDDRHAGVGGKRLEQPHSRRVNFYIAGLKSNEEFKIEAHEIDKTSLNVPDLDRNLYLLNSFSHLQGIQFDHIAGPVNLILGVHYTHLHAEEETRRGDAFQPVTKKTKLGSYVIGVNEESGTPEVYSIHLVQIIDLEKFYEFETLGVQAPNRQCSTLRLSPDDKRAIEPMEKLCKLENNRYIICLPWKRDKTLLPNNRSLVESRLQSLEKSLSKNEEKAKMYDDVIIQYQANTWAIPLSEEDLKVERKPVYYLPHHGVYRPDKKSAPV